MPYVGGDNIPGRGIGALDSATNVGGDSAGLQAVLAQLRARGVQKFDANAIRDIVNENARPGGDPSANGPNLGPVVLNLRNAGIEDASPMPSGGGRTSAAPTRDPVPPIPPAQDTSPQPPASSPGVGYVPPAMPPPAAIVNPPGGPMPMHDIPGPPRSGDPVTNPVNPQLNPPPAGAAVQPPGGGPSVGSAIAAGVPAVALSQLLRGLFSQGGPSAAPPLALPAPPVQRALPAPEPQLRIAGPPAAPAQPRIEGPPPRLALPAPPPSYRPPLIEGQPNAGFQPEFQRPPDPVGASIDKAVPADAPVAPRARAKARRLRLRD